MKKQVLFLTIGFVLITFVIGCATNQLPSGQVTKEVEQTQQATPILSIYKPVSIVTFASADEGELTRFYFQIQDDSGTRIPASGIVYFKILDNSNNVLYEKTFSVSSTDYQDYQILLTGQSIGKAYEWKVRNDEIKKGISAYGKAELKFETASKSLSAVNEFVKIPSLTEEEIEALNQEQYDRNAIQINKKISKGDWEITVTKVGYYKPISQYGESQEYFRVDMIVKSIAKERAYFSPSGMVILDDNGNQYEAEYGGTLDTFAQIYPEVTKEGYILFKSPPKTVKSAKLIFEAGHFEDFRPIKYQYDLTINS